MPADRITSYSPWHVLLVLDDSDAMAGKPVARVNQAVDGMINEMRLLSGGIKPYFRVTVIRFGSEAEILSEAQDENRIEMGTVTGLQGNSGVRNCGAGLRLAYEVLRRNRGQPGDFEPFVFFFCSGPPFDGTSEATPRDEALEVAEQLKSEPLPAGAPRLMTVGFDAVDDDFMRRLASEHAGRAWYKKLESADDILGFLPEVGNLAASDSGLSTADTVADSVMQRRAAGAGDAPANSGSAPVVVQDALIDF